MKPGGDTPAGQDSRRHAVRSDTGEKRLVVLISGRGSNLSALIEACSKGRIDGKVVRVISNRPRARGLNFARQSRIPYAVVDHGEYPDREGFDRALAEVIEASAPDLIVLAGFMRVLTDAFVAHFAGRMVNIHPSLLPDFRGLDTHARALAAGVEVHGASVHFVTAELDGGPVLMQAPVPVHPDDDPETLAARVRAAEHRLYPAAVGLICSGRIQAVGDKVWCDGIPLERPLLLDEMMENAKRCAGHD
nr:phosphoribosylglycinamide formyltransferase [Thioalkalivibrio sp.]